jgi:hypothetical protein
VWAVHTREGNYGVLEVTDVNIASGTSLIFDWKYQPNGTTDFPGGGTPAPPNISNTSPYHGETNVDPFLTAIIITFSDSLAAGQSGNVLVEGGLSGTHAVTETIGSLSITWGLGSEGFIPGELVTVSFSGYESLSGGVTGPNSISFEIDSEVGGSIVYGSQTLIYQGYGQGDHFDFSTGMIVPDTVDADVEADFTLITNEGTNIGNEGISIPGPMLLLLPESDLGSVTSIPPTRVMFHGLPTLGKTTARWVRRSRLGRYGRFIHARVTTAFSR